MKNCILSFIHNKNSPNINRERERADMMGSSHCKSNVGKIKNNFINECQPYVF
jgi:hypothetical protein